MISHFKLLLSSLIIASLLLSCGGNRQKQSNLKNMEVKREVFGLLPDSTVVYIYSLTNKNGMTIEVTNYGGIITSIMVPDKKGNFGDIVLGYDELGDYLKTTPYFGAIVGRYANRIAGGKFSLDGMEYKLAKNNGENHLHGGIKGFDKVVWDVQDFSDTLHVGLKLHYLSRDGEEGYPGNLDVTVIYSLTNANELKIDYLATTDKATPINITQHSYFNLAGASDGNILGHLIMIDASRYTVVNSSLIPTGELRDVKGTPMDFTTLTSIGARIKDVGGDPTGYDHNYVLNTMGKFGLAARVSEPLTGRVMEVYTDQPGVQFYTGNFLDGTIIGKEGKKYKQYYGFCLETQHFPDSPNQPAFPSVILRPGETFRSTTIYRFLTN